MAEEIAMAEMEKQKELRKKKVDTAVKFLQNPKVRQTSMSQRRSFLEKKGLTKEEIDLAIAQSGTASDEIVGKCTSYHLLAKVHKQNIPPPLPVVPIQLGGSAPGATFIPLPHQYPVSWKGYIGVAVLGGSLGYMLVNIVKKFIIPLIYDKREKEQRLERIENSVNELSTGIMETVGGVQATLDSVQKLLEEQQKKIICLSADVATTQTKLAQLPTESYSVGDLKAEIVSLKGLLLNRKQFPSPVIGSTPAAPGIPTWQRAVTAGANSSTTPSASTSFAASNKAKGGGKITESGDGHPKMNSEVAVTLEHSTMNGEAYDSRTSVTKENEEESNLERSEVFDHSSSSSSDTDTPNTVKAAALSTGSERSLNEAIIEDEDFSVLSTDTSDVSSLSDISANASFHEGSIAFSSTCIKVPAEAATVEELQESVE